MKNHEVSSDRIDQHLKVETSLQNEIQRLREDIGILKEQLIDKDSRIADCEQEMRSLDYQLANSRAVI